MKIGVIADCFKLPLRDGIKMASEMGFDGVQIYATSGEFSSDNLDVSKKLSIKNLLQTNSMEISALCGDMGGYGFQKFDDNAERIEKTKQIINLASEFQTSVVTTHIGVIPKDKAHPRYNIMLDALCECGLYAKKNGVTLAIETGPESADTLLAFLKDTTGGVGVNLDPANFVMVTGQDPVEAVLILKDYIVHTHAKDGIMYKKTDPEIIYDCFARGGIEALNMSDYFSETPIGEGNVNFTKYIEMLEKIGYDGYLTVERETGDNPIKDIRQARKSLLKYIG